MHCPGLLQHDVVAICGGKPKKPDFCFFKAEKVFSKEEIDVYKNFDPKMRRKVGRAKRKLCYFEFLSHRPSIEFKPLSSEDHHIMKALYENVPLSIFCLKMIISATIVICSI